MQISISYHGYTTCKVQLPNTGHVVFVVNINLVFVFLVTIQMSFDAYCFLYNKNIDYSDKALRCAYLRYISSIAYTRYLQANVEVAHSE